MSQAQRDENAVINALAADFSSQPRLSDGEHGGVAREYERRTRADVLAC